ncbi:MAG: glycine betaine ABC transporter substrate-binding protein [Planctomycetota bacterium]
MRLLIVGLITFLAVGRLPAQSDPIVVGSKNFTESAILGEILAQWIESETDLAVRRKLNLGGTLICWEALQKGEIDLYVDYTGTAWSAMLGREEPIVHPGQVYLDVVRSLREQHDVRWLEPLGLNNTYALAMVESRAEELGIRTISDLAEQASQLEGGFSIEFTERPDGLPGLLDVYGLDLSEARPIEHALAYEALLDGSIDVMDVYSTDGKLRRFDLRVLEDDRSFFPPYEASALVNGQTARDHPQLQGVLSELAFRIPDETARSLNFLVESEGDLVRDVARAFLEIEGLVEESSEIAEVRSRLRDLIAGRGPTSAESGRRSSFFGLLSQSWRDLMVLTGEHLLLTLLAVLFAALVAVPLGILILERPYLRELILGAAGVVQTIPSLALLAFMIPLFGLDPVSAVAALFLYAMLPILRNTYTGIVEVDPDLIDAARGMGMRPREILVRVQLPLASRTILAGVRTSAVISIGVATLAAFIGAGGLGEPIVNGLYLNDTNLILLGAIPAALLAVLADRGLASLETVVLPRGVS